MPKGSAAPIAYKYGGLAVTMLAMAYFISGAGRDIAQLDDAYISYRYALNLAQGHGLVYNIGERVEGFTNLLWTLLVALGFWLTDLDGPAITRPLSVACGLAGLLAAWRHAYDLLPTSRQWTACLVPAVILTCANFFRWHTSGLETPLFIALVVASCWAASFGRAWWTALGCVLATLTRPDGTLLAACLIAAPALWTLAIRRPRTLRAIASIAAPSCAYALFIVLLTLVRVLYYGDPFPNTFHAKIGQVGWERGVWYVASFLSDGPAFLIPGAVAAAWFVPRLRAPLFFALIYTLYVIDIGGDVFLGGRFMLAPFPILVVANIVTAGLVVRSSWLCAGLLLPALLCGFIGLCAPLPPWSLDYVFGHARPGVWFALHKRRDSSVHVFPREDERMKARIALMRGAVPGLRTLATVGVGRVGYFAMDITILDLVGLLDRHIARSEITVPRAIMLPGHSRTDAAYVLARAPDIIDIPVFAGYVPPGASAPIIPMPEPGSTATNGIIHLPCVMQLWQNPGLVADYVFVPKINAWIRKADKSRAALPAG